MVTGDLFVDLEVVLYKVTLLGVLQAVSYNINTTILQREWSSLEIWSKKILILHKGFCSWSIQYEQVKLNKSIVRI